MKTMHVINKILKTKSEDLKVTPNLLKMRNLSYQRTILVTKQLERSIDDKLMNGITFKELSI